jgi:AraC-like DNA-binding protein
MASGDTGAITFSNGELPPAARLAAYRDMLGRSVGRFEVEALDDTFDFRMRSFSLPGLGVAQIASSALRIERTRTMPIDTSRDLVLAVVHEGTATSTQRGGEVTVRGSGAYLTSSHEPVVTRRTAARLTNYSLLRRDLAPDVRDIDRVLLTAMPVDSEAMRLLTGYTRLALEHGTPGTPEASRLAVRHIQDLIALAIGATRDAAETAKGRGLRAARRAELLARAARLIALRCDEPELSTAAIAHALGVSSRLLQKVFADHGETVMARVWDARIDRAARLLSAADTADRSVTDIAFACGFNDSSHFGRMFAARMGLPPSRWRRCQRIC